jgi:hypothetical protein
MARSHYNDYMRDYMREYRKRKRDEAYIGEYRKHKKDEEDAAIHPAQTARTAHPAQTQVLEHATKNNEQHELNRQLVKFCVNLFEMGVLESTQDVVSKLQEIANPQEWLQTFVDIYVP